MSQRSDLFHLYTFHSVIHPFPPLRYLLLVPIFFLFFSASVRRIFFSRCSPSQPKPSSQFPALTTLLTSHIAITPALSLSTPCTFSLLPRSHLLVTYALTVLLSENPVLISLSLLLLTIFIRSGNDILPCQLSPVISYLSSSINCFTQYTQRQYRQQTLSSYCFLLKKSY